MSPNTPQRSWQVTLIATIFALTAFAANSVFCRMALGERSIDPWSFTAIRLLSGAALLILLVRIQGGKKKPTGARSRLAPWMLFAYALFFSVAYLSLDTATGALILFSAVQMTMILYAQFKGQRLNSLEWLGALLAFGGFIYLVSPHLTQPSAIGFGFMTLSGIGWGAYSLIGRSSKTPLVDTCSNFVGTWPLVLGLLVPILFYAQYSPKGILLALLSGMLASGAGYAVWYLALGGLSATQAAVAQLLVPVIAAFGGIWLVGEALEVRLMIAAALILGGIATVFLAKSSSRSSS